MQRAICLLLLGLCGLLPGLSRLTPERQQELRVVLVAQAMAEGGSWLIPEFQRNPRLKKPPLAYWASAALVKASGLTDRIWLYRVPGALAGIGLLFAIWRVGRRLLDPGRGFAAAVLAGTSFVFLRHARLAETDVMLSMFIVWAIWAGLHTGPARRADPEASVQASVQASGDALRHLGFWVLAGLLAGLAFLTKGLAAVIVPPLALMAIGWFRRDLVRASVGGIGLAILAFVLIALPWYAYIWNHPEAHAAMRAETAALMGENKHTGPLVYYLYTGLLQLFPLSLLLIALPFRRAELTRWKAALAWLLGVLLLLSLLPSKQAHYNVLLLAPAALLAATWPPIARWITTRRSSLLALGLLGLGLLFTHVVYPRTQPLHHVRAFVEEARPELEAAPLVHVVGVNSAIFEFHVGRVVHNIESASAALKRAGVGDAVLVIGKRERVDLPPAIQPKRMETSGSYVYALYVKTR